MRMWLPPWHWALLVLLAWASLLIYLGSRLSRDPDPELGLGSSEQWELGGIMAKLERLRKQNEDLRIMAEDLRTPGRRRKQLIMMEKIASYKQHFQSEPAGEKGEHLRNADVYLGADVVGTNNSPGPGAEQERLQRKVENGVKELWFFVRSELKKLQEEASQSKDKISSLLEDMGDRHRSILIDLELLSDAGGRDEWRAREAQQLTEIVQKRLHLLQNPPECSSARKLVCNINKGCGFGCQLHHVVYCFMIAYGTHRTLVLESRGWRYNPYGFEKVFLPVSDTCTDRRGRHVGHWAGEESDREVQVVELPIVDSLHPRPAYLPLAVPEDLAPRLARLHGAPPVWWVAQFVKFLMRPQPWLEAEIQERSTKLGFDHPIVGVHVRRTDKVGTEAAFHSIDEYMSHVQEVYALLALHKDVPIRRVYLATDDPKLLAEAQARYPKYRFISDNGISRSAGLQQRYSESSLLGVILDIHFLAQSDFLVCTFSSQVCRVAYEIMQTLHPDASMRFRSLDDIYYFGGQNAHNQVATYGHTPRGTGEIELRPGDVIGIAGNHWDGYSKGMNRRTGRTGLYPSYKVQEKLETVKYPTYQEAGQ
uniref:Alpha-(1,6)-fucosyltransferase n=1 Tax=Eptatretus burgeri TaxID=7764 RepID=A0A8C4QCX5_EPTBU